MRNEDNSFAGKKLVDSVKDLFFGQGIDAGGRFVEDGERGIPVEETSNDDLLCLSCGRANPAFVPFRKNSLITIGKGGNKIMGLSHLGGGADFFGVEVVPVTADANRLRRSEMLEKIVVLEKNADVLIPGIYLEIIEAIVVY